MKVKNSRSLVITLSVFLFFIMIAAIGWGAVHISVSEMISSFRHLFNGQDQLSIHEGVFLKLRLPRVLLCMVTGSILAVSGVMMQGLFRNPIVEPGLAGTSAGAALGASIVFVLSAEMPPEMKAQAGQILVPLFAFATSLIATFTVYLLAKHSKYVSILSMLLIGMAVNAVAMSGTGFMTYLARDPQARSITFWNMGTFSGASWMQVFIVGSIMLFVFSILLKYGKMINALLLGEEEATYLGVNTEKLKRNILILNTLMVSVATAFVGVISFIGLIVPHILRTIIGSDNRILLPASALLGAMILLLADLFARLLLAPAEIPIGIITSLVGAPVFIFLLKKSDLLGKKTEG